jgi:hypothetical protein
VSGGRFDPLLHGEVGRRPPAGLKSRLGGVGPALVPAGLNLRLLNPQHGQPDRLTSTGVRTAWSDVMVLTGLAWAAAVWMARSSLRFLPKIVWSPMRPASRRAGFARPGRARLVQVERPAGRTTWTSRARPGCLRCAMGRGARPDIPESPGSRGGAPAAGGHVPGRRAGGPARRRAKPWRKPRPRGEERIAVAGVAPRPTKTVIPAAYASRAHVISEIGDDDHR